MHLMGQLRNGVYSNIEAIHADTMTEYAEQINGHADQALESVLDDCIEADVSAEIRHDAVKAKPGPSPFKSISALQHFEAAMAEVAQEDPIPRGFGLCKDEWGQNGYPSAEIVLVACKEVIIPLPFRVWYPRAVQWIRGLVIMDALTL
jgi:hypothetical protein